MSKAIYRISTNQIRLIGLAFIPVAAAGCGGLMGEDSATSTKKSALIVGAPCTDCEVSAASCTTGSADNVACEGPWFVEQWNVCDVRHLSCGCDVYGKSWQRTGPKNRNQTQTVDGSIQRFRCLQEGRNGECYEPDYYFDPSPSVASSNCTAALNSVRQSVEQQYGRPGQNPRQLIWSRTTSSVGSRTGNRHSGYRYSCSIRAEFTIREYVTDTNICVTPKACPRYSSTCGANQKYYAHVGRSKNQLRQAECPSGSAPDCSRSLVKTECLTGDNVPLVSTPQALQTRFNDTNRWLTSPPISLASAESQDSDLRETLNEKLQLLYELKGADLTSDQRATARSSYMTYPAALQCGKRVDPTILGQCSTTDWRLQYCGRMSGADPRLLWNESTHTAASSVADFCAGLLPAMINAGCTASNAIGEAFEVEREILRNLAGPFETEFSVGRCQDVASRRNARAQAAARMFGFVDDWYTQTEAVASTQSSDPVTLVRLDDELSGALSDVWSSVDKSLDLTSELIEYATNGTQPQQCTGSAPGLNGILKIMQESADRSIQADQDLIRGAMTSMDGLPLLAALGHISQAEIGRIEAQKESHDLACRFSGCQTQSQPAQTQVAYLYRLFSLMDRIPSAPANPATEGLVDALRDTGRPSTDWYDTFEVVQSNQSRIIDALGGITNQNYDPAQLDDLDLRLLPRSARSFVGALKLSKLRYQAYAKNRAFELKPGNFLRSRVDVDRRTQIGSVLSDANGKLTALLSGFEAQMSLLMRQVIDTGDNAATITRLQNSMDDLEVELLRLDSRRDAHTRQALANDISEQVSKAWLDVNGVLDAGGGPVQFIEISRTPQIVVTGNEAPQNRFATSIHDLAVAWDSSGVASSKVTASPGEMLSISTSGEWSPKCALESIQVYGDDNSPHPLSAPLTGPAGYSLTKSGSTYSAESSSTNQSHSVGANLTVCTGTGIGGAIIGVDVSACAFAGTEMRWSDTSDEGSDSRTSASFQGGFYHPDRTPFYAPLGSLLLIEMPANETDISQVRDVHLLRSPQTTVVVRKDAQSTDSDFYLVVNDAKQFCSGQADTQNRLRVDISRLWSQQAQAQDTLNSMGEVLEFMRAQEKIMVQQREILPHQLANIVEQARALLPPHVRVRSDYPPALGQTFDALVVAEKSRLEHAVRLASLDDERERLIEQMNVIQSDLAYASRSQDLVEALPRWSARNLDIDEIEAKTAGVTSLLVDYVFPVLQVWYHTVLQRLQTDMADELNFLSNQRPGTSLYLLADNTRLIADYIVTSLNQSFTNRMQPANVAISFPRPNPPSPICPFCGPAETAYNKADAVRSKAVWDAIDAGEPVTVHILPEDIYRANGGTARLGCGAASPVILDIGVAIVDDSSLANPSPGNLDVSIDVLTSDEQLIATPTGPMTFNLMMDDYTRIHSSTFNHLRTMPGVVTTLAEPQYNDVGYPSSMIPSAWSYQGHAPPNWDPVGQSPFASFVFDLSTAVSPTGVIQPSNVARATELVIFMKVESVNAGAGAMNWVKTCQPETGDDACGDGVDNDSDGDVDCADSACIPICNRPPPPPPCDPVTVSFNQAPSADGGLVLDGDTSTGVSTGYMDWQTATIDLGCTKTFNGLRRHMHKGTLANRGVQGEQVLYSTDGSSWTSLTSGTTTGWENYFNYGSNNHAWHSVPYQWSEYLRPTTPMPVRYLQFRWDGSGDSLDEIEIDAQ